MTKITITVSDEGEDDKASVSCHVDGSPSEEFKKFLQGEECHTGTMTTSESIAVMMLISFPKGEDFLDDSTEGMLMN